MFKIIVAVDNKNGIGKDNLIPWYSNNDLKFFKEMTTKVPENSDKKNIVVMGRKTFQSIKKELPNRINVVLSRTKMDNVINYQTIYDFLKYVNDNKKNINNVFIIGGGEIYKEFLNLRIVSDIYLTKIDDDHNCNIFFPVLDKKYYKEQENIKFLDLNISHYTFFNHEENNYLEMMQEILFEGDIKDDRTGIGTMSKFGKFLSYDVSNNILPILTTKRIFFRGIVEELFWFLSGSTDAKKLQEKNVSIWDGNSSREFLDSRKLNHLEEGDIGAGYGFQLRHFGDTYKTCKDTYKGVDQLKNVINLIKNDPSSRRILFSYWNPANLDNVALPPCHLMYQFYCNIEKKELSCNLYQRSSDYFLANNFNSVSAIVLMHLIGNITGYTPKTFNHFMGDTHIYLNHEKQCKEQLLRTPTIFPLLFVKSKKEISDYTIEDLELLFYSPQATIKAPMAV